MRHRLVLVALAASLLGSGALVGLPDPDLGHLLDPAPLVTAPPRPGGSPYCC